MWQDWANAILGLWVIVIPYLGMTDSGLKSVVTISGIVIIFISIWSAISKMSSSTGIKRTL